MQIPPISPRYHKSFTDNLFAIGAEKLRETAKRGMRLILISPIVDRLAIEERIPERSSLIAFNFRITFRKFPRT